MADPSTCPPLIPRSVATAYSKIQPYVHQTPLLTSQSLDKIASSQDPAAFLSEDPPTFGGDDDVLDDTPKFRLHFKCENFQKIGAFKARGAFHAVTRLVDEMGIEEVRRRGVVTHSSGNHAQALALAASTFHIPSYIVMPTISTSSKIAGTRLYTPHVLFSGSTSDEREAVVAEVVADKGAILVPPYDHPDIILGQGTVGLEMERQFQTRLKTATATTTTSERSERSAPNDERSEPGQRSEETTATTGAAASFDAVIAPIGGGGLLGGIATWFAETDTLVFGAEPSHQGADDARRGRLAGERIPHVRSLTIADGLRTPVGHVNWGIVSDRRKVENIYSVTESQIKMAMRLVFERLKVVVEPSGCVGLAVVLFNREFRQMVAQRQLGLKKGHWDVGIVFSGGNTTMKAIAKLFAEDDEEDEEENDKDNAKTGQASSEQGDRQTGTVGMDGQKLAEDVAG